MSLSEKDRALISKFPVHVGLWGDSGTYTIHHADLAALLQAAREEAPQGAGEPVALAHVRLEDDGLYAELEVLDGAHLQVENSPVKLYLAPPDPQARIEALERERDAWKAQAEHHFAHMRAALDLSYHLRYPPCPTLLDQVADLIDCGDGCESAWREHDTNATGCARSESAEGCPFEMACGLREFAKALRIQAWTLAFAPRTALNQGADHDLS